MKHVRNAASFCTFFACWLLAAGVINVTVAAVQKACTP